MILDIARTEITGSFTALDYLEIGFNMPITWKELFYPFDMSKTVDLGNNVYRLFFVNWDFAGYSDTILAAQVGHVAFDGPGNEPPAIVFGQLCDKNGLTGEPMTTEAATTEEATTAEPTTTTEERMYKFVKSSMII